VRQKVCPSVGSLAQKACPTVGGPSPGFIVFVVGL
jgi:hypothetical protein